MAKIVVYNDDDPAIGIVLIQTPGDWYGECTECGWALVRLSEQVAIESARRHVDNHDT